MLVQFTVENFMSFEKETTFSMAASPDDAHPDHVCQPENNEKGGPLLRAAALYGANASGKSNLIKAIAFARNLIVEGTRFGDRLYPPPFRLSDAREKPSRFQFIFRTGGVLYEYGFVLDNERIHEEWLFGTENTPRAKEKKYFERTTTVDSKVEIELGGGFEKNADERQRAKFVAEGMQPNQLFVSEAGIRKVPDCVPVLAWFVHLYSIAPDSIGSATPPHEMLEGRDSSFLPLLQSAGTSITKIATKKIPIDFDEDYRHLSTHSRNHVRNSLMKMRQVGSEFTFFNNKSREPEMLTVDEKGEVQRIEITFERMSKNGEAIQFAIDEESDGTRRLLYLLPYLDYLRQVPNAIILIDELDRRLHTLLSRTVLQVALSGTNQKSQLIFTTHDTNLLDLDLLRRDEIWFVEKDNGGASHLYSLADFKIRPDLKVEKGYLNGRFGAIPYIGDVSKLGFSEPDKADAETVAPEE